MAAPRAVRKGFLKVGSVSCGVKLVGATTEAGKVHFKEDGLPDKSAYVDAETGDVVPSEDQTKGYEAKTGDFLEIEPDEIKSLKLTSQRTLEIVGFVSIDEFDTRYLEKPYYIIPAGGAAVERSRSSAKRWPRSE